MKEIILRIRLDSHSKSDVFLVPDRLYAEITTFALLRCERK